MNYAEKKSSGYQVKNNNLQIKFNVCVQHTVIPKNIIALLTNLLYASSKLKLSHLHIHQHTYTLVCRHRHNFLVIYCTIVMTQLIVPLITVAALTLKQLDSQS